MPEKNALRIVFFIVLGSLSCSSLYGQSTAYVPVHEEYYHVPIFESDQMRVLDVRAYQGDTTAFHRHCNPIIYITLAGTTVSLKEPRKSWVQAELPEGWIGQDIYQSDSCFTHRFAIPDERRLHIVAVEALKNTDHVSLSSAPVHSEEGFSVFEIGLPQLSEIKQAAIPIIVMDSPCSEECEVDVIDSKELSKQLLKKHKAYAVFFERSRP